MLTDDECLLVSRAALVLATLQFADKVGIVNLTGPSSNRSCSAPVIAYVNSCLIRHAVGAFDIGPSCRRSRLGPNNRVNVIGHHGIAADAEGIDLCQVDSNSQASIKSRLHRVHSSQFDTKFVALTVRSVVFTSLQRSFTLHATSSPDQSARRRGAKSVFLRSNTMTRTAIAVAIVSGLILSTAAAQAATALQASELPAFDSAQMAKLNDQPCGKDTIAVINTDWGDRYIFCASDEGSATMEVLASGNIADSLLERFDNPLALFTAVVPKGTNVPEQVTLAIEKGQSLASAKREVPPFRAGVDTQSFEPSAEAKASCSTPSLYTSGFNPWTAFFHDSTYCGFVATSSSSSSNTQWHQQRASNTNGNSEGSHQHAGPHYDYGGGLLTYYADEDEDGGARLGRALVSSCSGTTRFRGWLKASPTTGSWGNHKAQYYVPQGSLYVMHLWANSQHTLWMGNDADDIRFRVDSLAGSTFGSRMYFAKYGWGTQCNIKY